MCEGPISTRHIGALPRRVIARATTVGCSVIAVALGGFPASAAGTSAYVPICYVTRSEPSQGVRITPMNEATVGAPGVSVRLDWSSCSGDGLAIFGPRARVRDFAPPRVRQVGVERSAGGYVAFNAQPTSQAHDWPIRLTPAPESAFGARSARLVRGWDVALDVPDDVAPGSYYAAVEFDRHGDGAVDPVVAFLAVNVVSEAYDDPWRDVHATLTSSMHDDALRLDYDVTNHSSYTARVQPGSVHAYSLFDRTPHFESVPMKLGAGPLGLAALVPRNDRRTLRLPARDAPLISCASYLATHRPRESRVRTLTTVRLPWGSYSRRGSNADQCNGILHNPVGRVVLGVVTVMAMLVAVATAYGAHRVVRRRGRGATRA